MTATIAEAFGNGSGSFGLSGNLLSVASAGVSPGATAADNVLAVFTLPAGSFDQAGRNVTITAAGGFAATANNKRVKVFINATTAVVGSTISGGTLIADTGTVATSGAGWQVQASVVKYGAAGSNTQMALHAQSQVGSAVAALLSPVSLTLVESGAIIVAVTGNATTATSDIVMNFFEINGCN